MTKPNHTTTTQLTAPELMLRIADQVMNTPDELFLPDLTDLHGISLDTLLARANLSLQFSRRDMGFRFRALYEDWDLKRTTREMY